MLFVKIKERAAAISSAVGFVDAVSCQSRLSSGVIETLGSSSFAVDTVDAILAVVSSDPP
jgi:hypothetical protein